LTGPVIVAAMANVAITDLVNRTALISTSSVKPLIAVPRSVGCDVTGPGEKFARVISVI